MFKKITAPLFSFATKAKENLTNPLKDDRGIVGLEYMLLASGMLSMIMMSAPVVGDAFQTHMQQAQSVVEGTADLAAAKGNNGRRGNGKGNQGVGQGNGGGTGIADKGNGKGNQGQGKGNGGPAA